MDLVLVKGAELSLLKAAAIISLTDKIKAFPITPPQCLKPDLNGQPLVTE